MSLLRVEAHLTSSADLTIILAGVSFSEICSGEKKSDYVNIRKKQKNNQGDIHRTVTNFVYDVCVKTPTFPFCTINKTALPFQSIFIFTLRLKVNSTLLHDE